MLNEVWEQGDRVCASEGLCYFDDAGGGGAHIPSRCR